MISQVSRFSDILNVSPPAATPEYLPDKYIIDTNVCFQVLDSLLCAS
jgi:hypothetical protein